MYASTVWGASTSLSGFPAIPNELSLSALNVKTSQDNNRVLLQHFGTCKSTTRPGLWGPLILETSLAGKPGQDTEGEARVLLEVVRNLKFRSFFRLPRESGTVPGESGDRFLDVYHISCGAGFLNHGKM